MSTLMDGSFGVFFSFLSLESVTPTLNIPSAI